MTFIQIHQSINKTLTSIDEINDVKSFLSQSFDMKDLGEADVILNIKLNKGENGITLL